MAADILIDSESYLKAVCGGKSLYEGVQAVGHAVSGRSTLPILSHIYIQSIDGGLKLAATDLELSISLVIPAEIETPGALAVPAKFLSDLLGTLTDKTIGLSVDNTRSVKVSAEHLDYRVLGLPAEEYPMLPTIEDCVQLNLSQKDLRDVIRKTIFAVSTDETRAILKGVYLELNGNEAVFVATDTHRLAVRRLKLNNPAGAGKALIPARALGELQRILADAPGDVEIRLTENQVQFNTPSGVTLIAQLIQGQFPNYQRVIPTSSTRKLTLQTEAMQLSLRRAALVAKDDANRIVLKTLDDELAIKAKSAQVGEANEIVDVIREGDDVEVAFNVRYMLDVLANLDSEGFYLELSDYLRPGVIRPVISRTAENANAEDVNDEYLCVLMPMQIT
jgi:DNA polymerase-3 subunit beta